MAINSYPNVTWDQFNVCNDDKTTAFEDMCRRIFTAEFLKGQSIPHSDHNTPGVEVLPICEIDEFNGKKRRISFQSKYFYQGSVDYSQIKKSARQIAKKYKGDLDLVYLFSNKTITVKSKSFEDIKNILKPANIDIYPISNSELLDLVVKYLDIANYFFLPRRVADSNDILLSGFLSGFKLNNSTGEIVFTPSLLVSKDDREQILEEVISEKVTKCKEYILNLDLEGFKKETDHILKSKINSINSVEELYFLNAIVLIYKNADATEFINKCKDHYDEEIKQFQSICNSTIAFGVYEFLQLSPEAEVLLIDKLFQNQEWSNISDIYKREKDIENTYVKKQIVLHYGLSLFNIHKFKESYIILQNLYNDKQDLSIKFYALLAKICFHNSTFQSGDKTVCSDLMNAIEELEQLNEIKQYKQNNKLVAIVKTESFYHLALSNISYAEKAISEYASYSEIVKTEEVVMFYYALCLELTGDIAKAIDVYQKLNWKSNPVIAEEYMMACVFSGDYNSVISSYNDLTEVNKTVALCSLYLFSLSKNNDSSFKIKIKELIEAHNDRLSDLVEIAKYNSEGNIIQKLLIPAINRTLNEKSLNELSIIQLNELIIFMSRNRQIELIEKIITNIIDLSVLNLVTLNEIYKVFFEVANREYSNPQNDFIKPNDFESVDKMSSMLLDHNVGKKYFLQIKVMCSIAQQLPFSTLKYSQELFEITRDAETAHKVVLSLINCKETSDEKYSKYIEAIKDSNNPNVCLAIANAKIICGNETEAEYYLYKSLYLLNGNDDYNILRDYFSICVGYFQGLHDDKPLDTIKGKCVLFLENIDNSKVIEVILDSEPEFSDEFNKSMDVEHIPLSSPDYAKLYSCGPRQIVKFHNKKYRIVSIMSRMQYGYRYIFRKLQENPGEFKGTAWVISADNPEEMIDKMKSIMDNTDHINSLLSLYHLEQNDIGLPIDSLSSGDYNKYIHSLKYLLYGNNQALYAGQVMYNSTYKKYVPDISTIALLATLGSLDIIDEIKKDIVIPQSYLDFVKIHYLQSKQDANANVTTLSFVDGKPTMYEFDKSISEIWELMYDFCFSCEKETVSNQERIACNVDGNLSLEKLLVGFKLSMVHLDAIALTRKQNAAFVCDDLFFRKISTIMKIANVNIASLAYSASKWDFLLNLSKTNYIYVPIRARDNNMMKELIHNLMNGEKKKLYYGSLINMMQKAWLNIIKTLQNNE